MCSGRKPTRREFVAAGAVALAACGRRVQPAPVFIARAGSYSGDLTALVRRMFRELQIDFRGKRVLLKPNLVEFDPGACINTHPAVVHAAWEAAQALGAAEVRIAEGPGHRRNTWELAEAAGYFATIPGFEDRFTDLNLDEVSAVQLKHPRSRLSEIYLPRTVLGSDVIVSLPKMKTHHWVGATLSLKNFFGVVPGAVYGWPKNVLHWAGIEESIADLHFHLPQRIALVDGIVGMEGNGPIQGTTRLAGVLVASRDLVAADATCCRIMGIDPRRVRYLKLAETRGQTETAGVHQIGEPVESVATSFELLPQFEGLRTAPRRPARSGSNSQAG
jgi:uncharacterized protein (DUF362 family)